jgi:multidrug efflux pump
MRTLLSFGLRKSRAVLTLLVLLFVIGAFKFATMPKESFPDIKIPVMIVQVAYDGISPEDSEKLLLIPLEKQLKTLDMLKDYKARAFEGGASITLEFMAGFDAKKAKENVKDKVDVAKKDLPTEAKDPQIIEINTSEFPVLTIKLSGHLSEQVLVESGHKLADAIQQNVAEVLDVKIQGDRTEQVEIYIDPIKLENYALDLQQILQFFPQNHAMISSGNLDTGKGRFPIKIPGLIENADDLMNMPLILNGDKIVTFKDIGTVKLTYQEALTYARDRGVPTLALEIIKRSGENLIDTVNKVKAVIEAAQQKSEWPSGLTVNYSQDQTKKIVEFLETLENTLILALILVMAVIIKFIGWRPSILVGLSVPGAFLIGVLILSFSGFTINTIVLFSFILAAGMLVDGAIIVVEYADRRMVEGKTAKEAYLEAGERMFIPAIASVGTIGIVFMPLLFWPGVVGEFMKFLPITVLFTLSGSLIMALFFTPILGAMFGKLDEEHTKKHQSDIIAAQNCNFEAISGFTGKYVRILEKNLHHPWRIIGAGILALIVVQGLYAFTHKGVSFFPDTDPSQAQINIRARGDLSGLERDSLVKKVENKILDMKELSSIYSKTIAITNGLDSSSGPADTIGTIFLEFIDWKKRRLVTEILDEIKDRCKDVPGVVLDVLVQKNGPSNGKPIEIWVKGEKEEDMEKAIALLSKKMHSMQGLQDIEDSRFLPGTQLNIIIDRELAAKYGTTIRSSGAFIRMFTNGIKLGSFRAIGHRDELDMVLRINEPYRTFDEIKNLQIPTSNGPVALSQFAKQDFSQKVGTIRRSDGSRYITIRSNVKEGVIAGEKIKEIQKWIHDENPFPRDLSLDFQGDTKDQKDSAAFLGKAFLAALLFMTFILVLQFNSFFSTLLILSAIVMSTVGVFLGVMIHQFSFSVVMGGISIIALAGIIVSNNILLIDTFDEATKRIKDVKTAILYTCAQRIRPIVLTHITVVLGLLPIVFLLNLDFINFEITIGDPAIAFWQQMAVCISYGVLFGSVLTLFVTPSALMARHLFRERKLSF